jgi:hypothetical protein
MKNEQTERFIAYLHGRIEAKLEAVFNTEIAAYAQISGITEQQLAARVAALLQPAQGGKKLGPVNRVSNLPSKAAKRGTSVEPLAVAGGTRKRSTSQGSKMKAWWAKLSPEERAKEVRRRRRKAMTNRILAAK